MNSDSETPANQTSDALSNIFLDFVYGDTDSYACEIAELYSYTEYHEFHLNVKAFTKIMQQSQRLTVWSQQDCAARQSSVLLIMEYLELTDEQSRLQAARAALYLLQGCWQEALTAEKQQQFARDNVLLLLRADAFEQFIALLQLELEAAEKCELAAEIPDMESCTMLRVVLSILYHITETLRHEKQRESADTAHAIANFVNDINRPLRNGELLSHTLLRMIWLFSLGQVPHLPVKKILLLLWKITLLGFGGFKELTDLKRQYRLKAGLTCSTDDETVNIVQHLSPIKISTVHLTDGPRMRKSFNSSNNQSEERVSAAVTKEDETLQHLRQHQEPTPAPNSAKFKNTPQLPWRQKTYQKDIDNYVQEMQQKYLGFSLPAAKQNVAGLPQPIKESVAALQRHVYISLAHVQMQNEEKMSTHPLSSSERDLHETPVELFYERLLPRMPEYMMALVKILQATMPTTRSTINNIDLNVEWRPKQLPRNDSQFTGMSFDTKRHKDIIVKAISALLLLYLKHFKLNHVYQFEFLTQCLMYNNCIPLIIRIVGQHPKDYVCGKNIVPLFEFPLCVLGLRENSQDEHLLQTENLFSWRNTFSCINLLRVLNKLVKDKESRVVSLMLCKSTSTLKKLLGLHNSILQLYVLKLLKMQSRLQGRAWRRSNVHLMSAIYTRVRHRMQDNWAYGCDIETRPLINQTHDSNLRARIESFNMRYYPMAFQRMKHNMDKTNFCFAKKSDEVADGTTEKKTQSFDEKESLALQEMGGEEDVVLTDYFKIHYERWLEDEVFSKQVDWDAL